jgi:hypothetical protein
VLRRNRPQPVCHPRLHQAEILIRLTMAGASAAAPRAPAREVDALKVRYRILPMSAPASCFT